MTIDDFFEYFENNPDEVSRDDLRSLTESWEAESAEVREGVIGKLRREENRMYRTNTKGQVEAGSYPGTLIEMLMLLHRDGEEADEHLMQFMLEIDDSDQFVLLRLSVGMLYGLICALAKKSGTSAESCIQSIALNLATGEDRG